MYHITADEVMNKGALEALVPVLKPLILYKGQQHDGRRKRAKNGSLLGRRNMHSMHERRKGVSSSAVIWYIGLFRQNRTDRPVGKLLQNALADLMLVQKM